MAFEPLLCTSSSEPKVAKTRLKNRVLEKSVNIVSIILHGASYNLNYLWRAYTICCSYYGTLWPQNVLYFSGILTSSFVWVWQIKHAFSTCPVSSKFSKVTDGILIGVCDVISLQNPCFYFNRRWSAFEIVYKMYNIFIFYTVEVLICTIFLSSALFVSYL